MKTRTSNNSKVDAIFSEFFKPEFAPEDLNIRGFNRVAAIQYKEKSVGDLWLAAIKQVFAFFPGTLFLFMCSNFIFDAYFRGMIDTMFVVKGLPWLAMWGFLTMFGIGDIKNPKHIAIPLSVIAVSFLVFLISAVLPESLHLKFITEYSIYFFPIALIAPFFAKDLLKD